MTCTLGQIADWIHAEGDFDPSKEAHGYSIDSRTISANELFFAVKGERVDGHNYVETAIANGAVAAVVSMRWLAPAGFDECQLLRVPDECEDCVLDALHKLAAAVRVDWGGRVIGVTGSAGKTTTKECVAHVLGAAYVVLKSEGNLNNHFGVPLQLLRLQREHQVAVIEMGMNHAGEIRALARIAKPDWAVISNVGPVHLEHFPDGIDGVARAKYELVEALPLDGVAVLNGDDERVAAFGRGLGDRAIFYGLRCALDVCAEDVQELGLDGSRFTVVAGGTRKSLRLQLMGGHNVLNALAAVAVGLQSDMTLDACCTVLEQMRPTAKRGEVLQYRGARLINDCYNSNPKALDAMVTALASVSATRRIVVAGEMLELGPESARFHAECGRAMSKAGVSLVLGVRGHASELVAGAQASGVQAEFVETPEAAGAWLAANLREDDVVLLKASRGVRLEKALDVLPKQQSPSP